MQGIEERALVHYHRIILQMLPLAVGYDTEPYRHNKPAYTSIRGTLAAALAVSCCSASGPTIAVNWTAASLEYNLPRSRGRMADTRKHTIPGSPVANVCKYTYSKRIQRP
jgi:hypothetical protein